MLEQLDPRVLFEIDVIWVETVGCDPAVVLDRLGQRAPVLHLKDGPAVAGEPMVPVGQGIMDSPRIMEAAAGLVDWMIVDLDSTALDPLAAIEQSCAFIVREGMARGSVLPWRQAFRH
jgi:sugar phosphate isomerase/epimerase